MNKQVESPSDNSDETLAEQAARRSSNNLRNAQVALTKLYDRHAAGLLAFLAARVRRSDLEEVHQAVWLRVWEKLPKRKRSDSFRGWLFAIARNYLIDRSRRKSVDSIEEPAALADDPGRGVQSYVLEKERSEVLAKCIGRLDEKAAVLVRARLQGDSYEEICPRIGLAKQTAHRLFHSAKEQLQKCVGRYLDEAA